MICSKDSCDEDADFFIAPSSDQLVKAWPVCDNHLSEAFAAMATVVPVITIHEVNS